MKTTDNCRPAKEILQDYFDNELDAERKTIVEAHLKECTVCGHKLEELEKTIKILSSIKSVEPSPFLNRRIMATISENSRQDTLLGRITQNSKILLPAFSVMFIMLVLLSILNKNITEQASPEIVYANSIIKTTNGTSLIGDSVVKYDDVLSVLLDSEL